MSIDLHEIQQQLARLAASRELVRSHKLLRFIDFTVEEMLAGHGHTLTEHRIGTEVYERPADFDPQLDGIVRTEARRLRKKLNRYYAGPGQNDPVVLEYPVGSYIPTFRGAGASHYLEALSSSNEMAERIRDFDWASTKLGVISTWPTTLKLAVETCLRSKAPSLVCWGPDFLVIYNDAKAREIGKRHPWALSRPAGTIFPDSWDRLKPAVQRVLQDGEQAWAIDERFLVETAGYPEERYFTLLFTPVGDGSGGTGGIAVAADETTTRVIGERRARILAELALRLPPAGDISAVYRTAASVLNEDPFDVPFACLYGVRNGRSVAVLEATTGVSAGTMLSPESVAFDPGEGADSGVLSHAFRKGSREVIDLGEAITDLPSGAWKRTPTSIVVLPIVEQRGPMNPSGFLVAGMSPHSHLDKDYRAFWESVTTEIAKSVSGVRAEEEKRKLVEQLSAADRAKSDFFGKVDFELRSLAMLLLGPLDDVFDKAGEAVHEPQSALAIAKRTGSRLLRWIDALLDYAALEAGRSQTFFAPTDLSAVTVELASAFRTAIERADTRLLIECSPLSDLAYVDQDSWEKIVLHLISNAVKFATGGEIGISVRQIGKRFELVVWDSGAGFPPGKLPQDSDQADRRNNTLSKEGLGIGLSIVRGFVDLHGGSLTIVSEHGQGSKVVVSIPAGTDHLPQDRIRERPAPSFSHTAIRGFVEDVLSLSSTEILEEVAAHRTTNGEGDWAARAFTKYPDAQLLIVDENHDMREYLTRSLSPLYSIQAVHPTSQVLEAVRAHRPDLVLADASTGENGGLDLLRKLRRNPVTEAIPVMLLSAAADEKQRAYALSAGADDWLLKPFSRRELMFRVQAQIRLHRTRQKAKEREQELAAATEAQRALFRAVLDQLPSGVIIAGAPSHEILFENRAAISLLGRRLEKLSIVEQDSRWVAYRIDGTQYTTGEWPLDRCLQAGEVVVDEEIELLRDDGEHRYLQTSATPVRDSDGQLIAAVLVFRDVSEQKRTHERTAAATSV